MQVQEDCVEDRFHHGYNLLKQFDLKGCVPRVMYRLEPIKGFVVSDRGGEAAIEYQCQYLLHHLHKTDSSVLLSPFWDYNYHLSGRILC